MFSQSAGDAARKRAIAVRKVPMVSVSNRNITNEA
jgi:hypothetical protein